MKKRFTKFWIVAFLLLLGTVQISAESYTLSLANSTKVDNKSGTAATTQFGRYYQEWTIGAGKTLKIYRQPSAGSSFTLLDSEACELGGKYNATTSGTIVVDGTAKKSQYVHIFYSEDCDITSITMNYLSGNANKREWQSVATFTGNGTYPGDTGSYTSLNTTDYTLSGGSSAEGGCESVTFTCENGTYIPKGTYIALLESGSGMQPTKVIVETRSVGAVIAATPSSLDFGSVGVNKTATKTLKVSGEGLSDKITISYPAGFSSDVNEISIEEAQAEDGKNIDITFDPQGTIADWSGKITLSSVGLTSVDVDVTAISTPATYTLTIVSDPEGAATFTGAGDYVEGTVVSISCTPKSAYEFKNWTGDLSGDENPTSITMDGNKTVGAEFSEKTVSEGPVFIATPADLALMNLSLSSEFELTADIDMTDVTFTGIGTSSEPFTGKLKGNGHVIRNLTYSKLEQAGVGFFNATSGAIIEKVGFENISITGNKKDVGGIIGLMKGGSLQECYVSGCRIVGYDHAGALVGGVEDGALLKNCYASGHVNSTRHQAGGLSGTLKNGGTIENCYFTGRVTNDDGRVIGLAGYHDGGTVEVSVKNSVCLASQVLSAKGLIMFRIFDNADDSKKLMSLINNYSLSTTILGKLDLSTTKTITDADTDYGTGKRNGANVSEADALTQNFYSVTLGWNFDDVWTFKNGVNYPVLKVFDIGPGTKQTEIILKEYDICISNNILQIKNLENNALVTVYNIGGQELITKESSGEFLYTLPSKGFYIVNIESNGYKKSIKLVN